MKTIIVLINVPKFDEMFLRPILTKSETKAANTADKIAYISHFFDSFLVVLSLPTINTVPLKISKIDKIIIKIVSKSPLFVVESKKNIMNKTLDKIKLDLSIGATLFTSPSLIAE